MERNQSLQTAIGQRLSVARAITVLIAVMLLVDCLPMAFSGVSLTMRAITAQFPGANLSWVVTILLLVGGATQPMAGKLADKFGAKQILLGMAAAYFVGSIVCALAPSLAVLLLGRALQALIWALPAVAYALFRLTFPERLVPIAVGMLATGLGVGIIFCPLLFGLLLEHHTFRSVFWFSAVYTVVVALPIAFLVPASQELQRDTRIGYSGMLIFTLTAGAVLLGVSKGAAWHWLSVPTMACFAAAVVLCCVFVQTQKTSSEPFLDLKFVRSEGVRSTLIVAFLLSVPPGGIHLYHSADALEHRRSRVRLRSHRASGWYIHHAAGDRFHHCRAPRRIPEHQSLTARCRHRQCGSADTELPRVRAGYSCHSSSRDGSGRR